MRNMLLSGTLVLLGAQAAAQAIDRYIEVVASDTVRLALQGIDYEVAMLNPFDAATIAMSAGAQEESDFDRLLRDAERKARESERQFLDLMKANGFVHRLSSTQHAEDYAFDSGKEAEVNTYLVELKDTTMMARFQKLTKGTDYQGTVKNMRFSDTGAANARLMAKLHEQAKNKAGALAAASGGQLGKLISATEMRESEGSIFEQLMKMERGRRSEGTDLEEGSSHSSSMVFRFALLMN
ncbi:MAG: hypothetical protein IPL52_15690 [Flavobacteriales bacterium]|nr:hypothetical protein [Flavobacteriales bacterium]